MIKLTYAMDLKMLKQLAKKSKRLIYAINTCYWKIGNPVYSHPDCDLPCGPRGEMLLEMDNPNEFIRLAEENPDHYGKYGLQAFVAAYHGNIIAIGNDERSMGKITSLETWDEYNEVIDRENK